MMYILARIFSMTSNLMHQLPSGFFFHFEAHIAAPLDVHGSFSSNPWWGTKFLNLHCCSCTNLLADWTQQLSLVPGYTWGVPGSRPGAHCLCLPLLPCHPGYLPKVLLSEMKSLLIMPELIDPACSTWQHLACVLAIHPDLLCGSSPPRGSKPSAHSQRETCVHYTWLLWFPDGL